MRLLLGVLVLCLFSALTLTRAEQEVDAEKEESSPSWSAQLQTRIVNGRNANKFEWPWQISLYRSGSFSCGGSIIKKNWVLTAAHCVRKNPNPNLYTVIVGGYDRRKKTRFQKTFRVRRLFYHHHYFRRHLRYDVALLELAGSVRISRGVKIVRLPRKNSRVAIGKICFVTGWGRLKGGGRLPSILQESPIKIAGYRHCRSRNGRIVHDPTMVCAGARRKGGACNGDSGGPLSCKENGRWVLRGVVSWGRRGCPTSHYTVFARVSKFIDWINKITGGKPPGLPQLSNSSCRILKKYGYCKYIAKFCRKICTPCRDLLSRVSCRRVKYTYRRCNRRIGKVYCRKTCRHCR